MSFLGKYQNIILGVVLIIVAFFAYTYFFSASPAPALTSTSTTEVPEVDQDLIALLSTLKTIKLDDSIFVDPAFQSLHDFSRQLVPEPVGRPNPFAPLNKK